MNLILHADDFGMNPAVTAGVLDGFRHGVLTSASLLANAPDAARAVTLWKQLLLDHAAGRLPSQPIRRELADPPQAFDLGLHLNLTQGSPLTEGYPTELLDPAGRFPGILALYRRLRRTPEKYATAIRQELCRQIEFLRDHGLSPTHVNGHHYVELLPAVSVLLPEVLERYRIDVVRIAEEPRLWRSTLLRDFSPARWLLACVKKSFARRFRREIARPHIVHPEVYYGTAHAGKANLSLLRLFLREAPRRTIEIGLHPARSAGDPPLEKHDTWHDPLAASRPQELRLLSSPELAEFLRRRRLRLGRLTLLNNK